MKITKKIIISFILITQILPTEIFAQQNVNGCGPAGPIGILVPNKSYLSNCEFKDACNNHDICYSKCLEGGELYGKQECSDKNEILKRKINCDKRLAEEIIQINNGRKICESYGKFYSWAVESFGRKFFRGITNESGNKEIITTFVDLLLYDVYRENGNFSSDDVFITIEKLTNTDISEYSKIIINKNDSEDSMSLVGRKLNDGNFYEIAKIYKKLH